MKRYLETVRNLTKRIGDLESARARGDMALDSMMDGSFRKARSSVDVGCLTADNHETVVSTRFADLDEAAIEEITAAISRYCGRVGAEIEAAVVELRVAACGNPHQVQEDKD